MPAPAVAPPALGERPAVSRQAAAPDERAAARRDPGDEPKARGRARRGPVRRGGRPAPTTRRARVGAHVGGPRTRGAGAGRQQGGRRATEPAAARLPAQVRSGGGRAAHRASLDATRRRPAATIGGPPGARPGPTSRPAGGPCDAVDHPGPGAHRRGAEAPLGAVATGGRTTARPPRAEPGRPALAVAPGAPERGGPRPTAVGVGRAIVRAGRAPAVGRRTAPAAVPVPAARRRPGEARTVRVGRAKGRVRAPLASGRRAAAAGPVQAVLRRHGVATRGRSANRPRGRRRAGRPGPGAGTTPRPRRAAHGWHRRRGGR